MSATDPVQAVAEEYMPQAWRFSDGPNQYYADQYAQSIARLDYDLDYDDSRFDEYKAQFLADLAAYVAAECDVQAARLAAVVQVLTEWGALDDGGFDSDFAEAIQESGAWRLSRDLRAALDGEQA